MNDFAGRTTRNFAQDHSTAHVCKPDIQGYCPCPLELADPDKADLVCSDLATKPGLHMPVIDLDMPCRLVQSSPGKFHLYIDKEVSREAYVAVLHAMADALLFARTSCKDATAYITHAPCPSCSKLLRGAGVTRVVHL